MGGTRSFLDDITLAGLTHGLTCRTYLYGILKQYLTSWASPPATHKHQPASRSILAGNTAPVVKQEVGAGVV